MTVEQKKRTLIGLALAAPLLLLLLLALIAIRAVGNVDVANATVLQTYRTLSQIDATLSLLKDAETGQRGFLLTGREEFLEPYKESRDALPSHRGVLAESLGNQPQYAGRMSLLDRLIDQKLAFMQKTIELRREHPEQSLELVGTGEGKRKMDEIRRAFASIVRDEKSQLAKRLAASDKRRESQYRAAFAVLAADILIVGLAVLGLYKVKRLRELVTVCAWTREIRHEGRWLRLEEYLETKFNYQTSHGLSERAAEELRSSP
jgi:CHASE3 domain sensor protein